MSVTYKDFIDFSLSLSSDDEISRRVAISRAYYACYHAALLLYRYKCSSSIASADTNGGTHKKLIEALQNSDNQTVRQIGDDLETLKKKRGRADYELGCSVGKNETTKAIIRCKKLIEDIIELLKSS